ncbi:hypothetical protein GX50_04601 [[Emmonsia] crescens]|uniref:Uncharacterized protein n=1 Tax=[Emmonsia] crescens TaxID=73230 RepID=A0A2B7ZF71_9EURO|nr:hypothetical protein GX50_04601 [Emmonsia crescens]
MSAPKDYHGTLTKLLASRGNQIFDIHFLPEGFGDLLHEGTEIGISKKALVQCFVKARQIFFSLTPQQLQPEKSESIRYQRRNAPETPHEDTPQSPPTANANPNSSPEHYSSQTLLLQTEILLLLDSEHLTACNWRKRRLCSLKEKQSQCRPSSASQYHSALHTEISFTTTILRSPLHRHTKSPVLWYHRKWTMMQLLDLYRENPVAAFAGSHHLPHYDAEADSAATTAVNQILNYEVSIVLQAGTHHPKNYYAFSYLREFMGLFADALAPCQVSTTTGQQQPVTIQLGNLAGMVLETLHTWCLAYSHRRDISAWSFLLWLLEVVGDVDGDVSSLRKTIVDKTARFGAEVSWYGEGLWIFVDLAVRRFGVDVDWLTTESRGDLDDDDDDDDGQAQSPARWLSSVGDVTVGDVDGPSTAPAPVPTASGTSSSPSNKRWKIWIRRMKASQERNDAPVIINDND